jgi:hypothetical protein
MLRLCTLQLTLLLICPIPDAAAQAPADLEEARRQHYGETYVRRFLGNNGWVLEVWTKDNSGKWQVSAVQVTPAAKK